MENGPVQKIETEPETCRAWRRDAGATYLANNDKRQSREGKVEDQTIPATETPGLLQSRSAGALLR
jgi:hypothetical protein